MDDANDVTFNEEPAFLPMRADPAAAPAFGIAGVLVRLHLAKDAPSAHARMVGAAIAVAVAFVALLAASQVRESVQAAKIEEPQGLHIEHI